MMFRKFLLFFFLLLNQESQAHIIICMSIPKCGTFLMEKLLRNITNQSAKYISPLLSESYFIDKNFSLSERYRGHIWPTEEILDCFSSSKFRGFLLIRDPRDQVLSAIDYIKKGAFRQWFNPNLSHFELFVQLVANVPHKISKDLFFYTSLVTANLEERYRIVIDAYTQLANFCLIRFEDLVGKQGGGSDEKQLNTIKNISQHIGIELTNQECKEIMNSLFGGSPTFNKGQIGRWKTEFTPEMKEFFKQHFSSEYLIELGYETTLDW